MKHLNKFLRYGIQIPIYFLATLSLPLLVPKFACVDDISVPFLRSRPCIHFRHSSFVLTYPQYVCFDAQAFALCVCNIWQGRCDTFLYSLATCSHSMHFSKLECIICRVYNVVVKNDGLKRNPYFVSYGFTYSGLNILWTLKIVAC